MNGTYHLNGMIIILGRPARQAGGCNALSATRRCTTGHLSYLLSWNAMYHAVRRIGKRSL